MAMRIKMPVENVEYTFRFPPKKKFTYRWYGDVSDKGRLILFNKPEGYYTGMTPAYFTFLCRNRLVNRTTVAPAKEKPAEVKPVECKAEKTIEKHERIEEQRDDSTLDAEGVAFVNKAIEWLNNLRPEDRHYLSMKFPGQKELSVTKMITDLNYIKNNGISDKGFGIMISRYLLLESTLSAFLSKLGGIK